MNKIKEYKGIIIIVLVILGVAFYWYQIRPVQIKKSCDTEAVQSAILKKKTEQSATYLFDREHWNLEKGSEPAYIQERLSLISKDNSFSVDDNNYYFKWCLQRKGL